MGWRDTIKDIPTDSGSSNKSGWKSTIQDIPEDPSILNTVATKAASGGSFGFDDELAGALTVLGKTMGIENLGGKIKDIHLAENGPTLDTDELKKSYYDTKNKTLDTKKQMDELHPVISTLAETAGSLAVPVMGAESFAGRMGVAAAQGGLSGLGNSSADDLAGMAKDTAIGAGTGAAMQAVGEKVLAPAFSKASNWISESGPSKAIGKIVAGIDPKATEHYLQNSADVNKSHSIGELADAVLNPTDTTSSLSEMRNKISQESANDWKTLGRDTTINKQDLLSIGDDFANRILKGKDGSLTRTVATGADADALKAIYKELDGIQKAYGENLSEADLKSIVQSLQKKAFGSDTYSQDMIKQLSGVFNDVLKTGNTDYAASVAKTADTTNALKQIESVFKNRQNPESYDKFNKAVKNLANKDEMSAANQAVQKIQENTGYDLKKDIMDSWTKSQFDKTDTNGSRKTMLGSLVGGAVGSLVGHPVIGAEIGGAAGFAMDRYSGQVVKSLLDGQISASQYAAKFANTKFSQVLNEAASRGNASLAATHFLLSQQNPEYRKLTNQNGN